MHFLLRMSIPGLRGARNAFAKNLAGFIGAILQSKKPPQLIVRSDIFGMGGDELREVRFGGGEVPFVRAFHSQAVTCERICRIFLSELFEHLPALAGCWGGVHIGVL